MIISNIYGYEQNKLQYDMMFHNCNLYEIQNMKLFNFDELLKIVIEPKKYSKYNFFIYYIL